MHREFKGKFHRGLPIGHACTRVDNRKIRTSIDTNFHGFFGNDRLYIFSIFSTVFRVTNFVYFPEIRGNAIYFNTCLRRDSR